MTSLSLCKKLAAVVTVPTVYCWYDFDHSNNHFDPTTVELAKRDGGLGKYTPATQLLSEWIEVFKKLGEVKGWDYNMERWFCPCTLSVWWASYNFCPVCGEQLTTKVVKTENWKKKFTEFCELAATDWPSAEAYVEGLL